MVGYTHRDLIEDALTSIDRFIESNTDRFNEEDNRLINAVKEKLNYFYSKISKQLLKGVFFMKTFKKNIKEDLYSHEIKVQYIKSKGTIVFYFDDAKMVNPEKIIDDVYLDTIPENTLVMTTQQFTSLMYQDIHYYSPEILDNIIVTKVNYEDVIDLLWYIYNYGYKGEINL